MEPTLESILKSAVESIIVIDARGRVAVEMPDEVREKAFDAFLTTKHRRTGLGLPIAKRVIDAHGGTIEIDIPPSGGTTISVELPLPR